MFCKKVVLKIFSRLIGKHLCQSLFFNRVAGLRRHLCITVAPACNFIKKETLAQVFSYFYRTPPLATSIFIWVSLNNYTNEITLQITFFKVGVSPSEKMCVVCFIESPLKVMKSAFYFILKALFVFKIFRFLSRLFGHVEKAA